MSLPPVLLLLFLIASLMLTVSAEVLIGSCQAAKYVSSAHLQDAGLSL